MSDECEPVSEGPLVRESAGAKLTPFGERVRAALLEDRSVVEGAVLAEVAEHGRMHRDDTRIRCGAASRPDA